MGSSKLRLAALVSHPIQYQAPLFRHVAARPDVDFTALFLSDHGIKASHDPGFGKVIAFDVPLLDGYRHRFLPNASPRPSVERFAGLVNPQVVPHLLKERYDALWVHGWAHASDWLAFGAAKAAGTPLLLRGETSEVGRHPSRARKAKDALLGSVIRSAGALLYIGEANRQFYRSFGATDAQLFFAPYSVDNVYFAQRADEARQSGERARLRQEVGAGEGDVVLLFVGKLIDRKKPLDLVRALARLGPRAVAVFVGDGEQRAQVEQEIQRLGVRAKVVGFANQSQLPGWYAASDVFVLPSTFERWGLVVNEAMAAGLPSVVSDVVGCGSDLVRAGESGAIFRTGDVDALVHALKPMVDDVHLRERLSKGAREVVARYDVSVTAQGVVDGARRAAGR